MAVSQVHLRSISLPSRLHPINSTGFEAELQKLKSCVSKDVPITSEAIQSGLLGLAELYNSAEELTQSPATQHEKSIEESLSCSVEQLDSCNDVRELAQMIKENVQTLQSALRRKGLDSTIQIDIASYFCFRKQMNKCIAKSLKTLKNMENENGASNLSPGGELTGLTIAILKSILVFFSWPAARPGGWNLVSRLMLTKSAASVRDQSVITEMGCVNFALNSLISRDSKLLDMQMVQRSLQNLDACVEGIEAGLERLFRQLVRSRVRLLNILTDY